MKLYFCLTCWLVVVVVVFRFVVWTCHKKSKSAFIGNIIQPCELNAFIFIEWLKMLRLDCSTLKFLEAFRKPVVVTQGLRNLGTDASKPRKEIRFSKQKSIGFLEGNVFLLEVFLVSYGYTINSSIFKQVIHVSQCARKMWLREFLMGSAEPIFCGLQKSSPIVFQICVSY